MIDKLVIVESPAKANTIKKFLGGKSKVVASMGHIRDLPKSKMGVNIENDFELNKVEYLSFTEKEDYLFNSLMNYRPAEIKNNGYLCSLFTNYFYYITLENASLFSVIRKFFSE